MIPLTMRVRIRKSGRRAFGLWFPVILIWIPLILLLVIASPLVLAAALLARIGGWGWMGLRLYALLFTVFFTMSGLRIEAGNPENEFALIFL
jgi:hypothetical protein